MNNVRFLISELEDLASGSGTRLDHLQLLCGRIFITVKKGQRKFLIHTSEGGKECPLISLSKGAI